MANKTLFCSFYALFCTPLRLKRTVFSQLLNKAIEMALWSKASICDKVHFISKYCREHQAGKKIISVNPVNLVKKTSCLSVFVAKTQRNLRNPRLINDLRLCNGFYICRASPTDVMSALQIHLFMQNEPKFRKVKFNVTKVLTRDYDLMDTWSIGKNKPNSNPIQTQYKPNSKPKQSQFKPKQTQSTRPNYGKPPSTPGEDTIQKPLCIFNTYCYIDDQWNPASPPGFTNFDGWISIFCFHSEGLTDLPIQDKIITGEPS